uniref:SDR family NAD(P)-dependent oxidoreductase n=1 Tax=Rhodococcus sp. R1101 TaxID=1170698 RepID=UPI0003629580
MNHTAQGTVVIFGGRSEIGVEVATRLAPGRIVILAARRADELAGECAAVRAAGATAVQAVEFDADALDTHPAVLDRIAAFGPIDVAVLAFGILGEQARAETDVAHAVSIVHTDYLAQVALLTELAQRL